MGLVKNFMNIFCKIIFIYFRCRKIKKILNSSENNNYNKK